MARKFRTADYEKTLDLQVTFYDFLLPDHLVRFIVGMVAQLDLQAIYQKYKTQGAPPYAQELQLGLLFYGYASGVFSSRKMEHATYEVIPLRFIGGDMHPDHDTLAHFRKQNLAELKDLFVQILLLAQAMGHLLVGNVSLDGSKLHADVSKSKAVSYQRLLAIEAYLQVEVEELFALPRPPMGDTCRRRGTFPTRSSGANSNWRGWLKLNKCWKSGLRPAMEPNRRNMKPSQGARAESKGRPKGVKTTRQTADLITPGDVSPLAGLCTSPPRR